MAVTNSIIIHGDSFTDNSHSAHEQWADLASHNSGFRMQNFAVTGDDIILDIEPGYATDLATRHSECTLAIIQGGVNDCAKSATTAALTAATQSCITSAFNAGLDVIVFNIAPWGNGTNWTAARQTLTEDYNAWVAAQSVAQGFTYVDMYSALGDAVTPENLDAAYDSGDGLHLTAAGQVVVQGLAEAVISPLLNSESNIMNLKLWRGAVEPAETGASGNETKLWRGAVEPAASTGVFGSPYYAAIGKATRPGRAPRGRRGRRGRLRGM